MTFAYISRSDGKTSFIFNSTVVRTTYLLLYYSACNLTVKRCLLEYRSNQYLLAIARSLMSRIYDTLSNKSSTTTVSNIRYYTILKLAVQECTIVSYYLLFGQLHKT